MTRLGRPPPLSSPPRRLRAQLGAAGVGWPPGSPAFCGASAGLFGSREPVSWVGGKAAQRKETSRHLSEHRQARRATEGQSTPLLARSSDSRPGLARKAPCEPSWSDPWPQCPPTKPVGRFCPHQRTAESPHVLPCMALLDLTSARDPRPLPDAGSAVGCGAGVGSSTAGRARQRVGAPEPGAGASAGASREEARGGGGAAPCSAGPVTHLSEQTCIVCVQSMQLSACFCVLRIS